MVGRRDLHDVEVLLLEHLAIIRVRARLLLRFLPARHDLGRFGEHVFIYIAQRDHLDGRHLDQAQQIGFAVPSAPDEAHTFRFVVRESRGGQACGAGFDELTAIH